MKSTIFYGRNNEPVLRLSRRYPLLFWQVQVVASVAKVAGLPYMVTQDVIDDLFELTAKELKQNGHGNFINMVRFHIKCKDATPAKAGINPEDVVTSIGIVGRPGGVFAAVMAALSPAAIFVEAHHLTIFVGALP